MSRDNPRAGRVARTIQLELAGLMRGLKDPRITSAGPPSINHVDVNSDLSVATVYVSFIGSDAKIAAAAVEALGRASARLRGPLGRLMNLRHAPELRFVADNSVDFTARLREIVVSDGAARRAADEEE